MTMWIVSLLLIASWLGFVFWRGKAYLQFFQQEEYDQTRFLTWIWEKRAFDITASLVFFLATIVSFAILPATDIWTAHLVFAGGTILALLFGIWRSRAILKGAKKPLVMTDRAKRILVVYVFLALIVTGILLYGIFSFRIFFWGIGFAFLLLQLPPFFLITADSFLKPFERRVKRRFLEEAKEKFANLSPTIIAVTGSYGKTSTKHILAHILSNAAPTLATPGSVNTEMGITRIIREQLEARHKYFIVEMGAYGPGSIKKLCQLTPPDLGIITAVGMAHYERFKSVETVFHAKFELADAVREKGGKTILNKDRIPENLLAERNKTDSSLFPVGKGEGFHLASATEQDDGLHLVIGRKDSNDIHIHAPVFGLHQGENITLAVAAALQLGLDADIIAASLKTLPQVRHRLEVKKSTSGPTILDDAYNANPEGFLAALETLSVLVKPGGRRMVITPGMVELGKTHEAEHNRIGQAAGKKVDVMLVVTPSRIPSFVKGFQETAPEGAKLLEFETQKEAENWLKQNAKAGDAVLFANNLPDLYERKVRF